MISSQFLCYYTYLIHCNFLKACFDFACICGSATCYDVVPHENVIRSILTVLGEDEDQTFAFR